MVWKGRKRGIFSAWPECEAQVKGFVGAQYKAFDSRQEAERAFAADYGEYRGRSSSYGKWKTAASKPALPSVCVDAACDGSPGKLEYRGAITDTGKQIFREGPFQDGTNNVGEFLAIVQAVSWLNQQNLGWPIYSDSENAITWVKAKKCNTKLKRTRSNARLFELISRAETELRGMPAGGGRRVMKWDTAAWGEIPADFGRK